MSIVRRRDHPKEPSMTKPDLLQDLLVALRALQELEQLTSRQTAVMLETATTVLHKHSQGTPRSPDCDDPTLPDEGVDKRPQGTPLEKAAPRPVQCRGCGTVGGCECGDEWKEPHTPMVGGPDVEVRAGHIVHRDKRTYILSKPRQGVYANLTILNEPALMHAAELVVSDDGRVLKSRWGVSTESYGAWVRARDALGQTEARLREPTDIEMRAARFVGAAASLLGGIAPNLLTSDQYRVRMDLLRQADRWLDVMDWDEEVTMTASDKVDPEKATILQEWHRKVHRKGAEQSGHHDAGKGASLVDGDRVDKGYTGNLEPASRAATTAQKGMLYAMLREGDLDDGDGPINVEGLTVGSASVWIGLGNQRRAAAITMGFTPPTAPGIEEPHKHEPKAPPGGYTRWRDGPPAVCQASPIAKKSEAPPDTAMLDAVCSEVRPSEPGETPADRWQCMKCMVEGSAADGSEKEHTCHPTNYDTCGACGHPEAAHDADHLDNLCAGFTPGDDEV